ncbi:MAG: hypothetical protein ABI378_02865 [Chitinophagaceae bacterium]
MKIEILLGDRILFVSSTRLYVNEQSIKSMEMNMQISCIKACVMFANDYKFGFFENNNGDVFYDFKIETFPVEKSPPLYSKYSINSSKIIQIEIYEREFNAEEFSRFSDVYRRVTGIKNTYDLFFITCENGEQFILTFHPFMPGIELFYKQCWIKHYWTQYGSLYRLNYTVKI